MKSLKKKFGKFAISQKQSKQITGGFDNCEVVFWCQGKTYPTKSQCESGCDDFCYGQYVFPC
ncbi:hypothetical protein V9L05_03440 [Bernardetia sp. Wsw4-3y2]|uniref:hypothetical protein n=1 Tax=unclassified Bernardetia TaxID=2647129 RepID=UPI0030D3721D